MEGRVRNRFMPDVQSILKAKTSCVTKGQKGRGRLGRRHQVVEVEACHACPSRAIWFLATSEASTRRSRKIGKQRSKIFRRRDANATRTRHDTTRHDTTRHDTTRHDTTRYDTTRHDKARQDKEDKTRQDKTRQDKTRQDKTRQDKTRQDKTRQDKTYHLRCLTLHGCYGSRYIDGCRPSRRRNQSVSLDRT
jgi:hypothetical protein